MYFEIKVTTNFVYNSIENIESNINMNNPDIFDSKYKDLILDKLKEIKVMSLFLFKDDILTSPKEP